MSVDPLLVRRLKKTILSCLAEEEHGRVRIGEPVRRQNEIRLVVDNFDVVNVTTLMRKLPSKTRIFCRAVPRASNDVVLSRIEIYYFLESFWWRVKWIVMFFVWVLVPLILSLSSLLFYTKSSIGNSEMERHS